MQQSKQSLKDQSSDRAQNSQDQAYKRVKPDISPAPQPAKSRSSQSTSGNRERRDEQSVNGIPTPQKSTNNDGAPVRPQGDK